MILTKAIIASIVAFLLISAFVATLSEILSSTDCYGLDCADEWSGERIKAHDSLTLGDKFEHIKWFVQISDIHISKFHDPTRLTQLRTFCQLNIPAIKPSVVLASGDLTDAKTSDALGSRQIIEEWKHYQQVLESTGVLKIVKWLDVRGNHDNFNVPSLNSSQNYHRIFSVQGKFHPRSYSYVLTDEFSSYAFIAVDACLEPGPRRPFNFIGMIGEREWKTLKSLEKATRMHNYTIWFGHYPTSCIISPSPGIRSLMKHSYAYMCGHLHTLGGWMKQMYAVQKYGNLELELADWKDQRMYRVMAIDHGLFSFVDISLDQWPVVLITNPKDARFLMSDREPIGQMRLSTNIRMLVFSPHPILEVKVKIDDDHVWKHATKRKSNFFVLPWEPHMFQTGIHTIKVLALDQGGNSIIHEHEFSLDGTSASLGVFSRLLLLGNASILFQTTFGVFLFLSVIPLCLFRWLHWTVVAGKTSRPSNCCSLFDSWVKRLWILSTVDGIFYTLLFMCIYVAFGPWFIGEVIDGYLGVAFVWGIIVNGSYIPGSFTYAYGFLHFLTFQIPLTATLANAVLYRFNVLLNGSQSLGFFQYFFCHLPFVILVSLQVIFAYLFGLAYGTTAFLLGPLRTWSTLVVLYLWYYSCHLSKNSFRNALQVWSQKSKIVGAAATTDDNKEL